MNKKGKKILSKLILFLILSSFIIFGFWYMKKNSDVPVDSKTPSQIDDGSDGKTDDNKETEPSENSYLNNITYTVNIDDAVKKTILEYFDTYYKTLKELKEYDMTYLFSDQTSDQAYINQTAVSLLVSIRKLKTNDLTLSSAKYDLNIKKVNGSSDELEVTVLENSYLHFNFMKDTESKIYNIENEFKLKKINDEYKIVSYNKVQDFFVMITDIYKSGGKNSLDQIKNDYLKVVKNKIIEDQKNYQAFLKGEDIEKRVCDNSYDRTKALEYAKKWINKRNPDWTAYESNCQNFVSQVLYNGGIPMDYHGSASSYLQWKSYSSSYNENETPNGLVYTWTYVPYFYQYAKNNTGYGLCASVDVNMYYAEAGDVIHVGTSGPTRHALIVIGTYKRDGKVVDVLVNSNTVDLENYPMSAYVYPYASLIKIYGWNN